MLLAAAVCIIRRRGKVMTFTLFSPAGRRGHGLCCLSVTTRVLTGFTTVTSTSHYISTGRRISTHYWGVPL